MKFKALGLASIAIVMYSPPGFAHHSFAMFDSHKDVTLVGTVKEFRYSNPHIWIFLAVTNDKGKTEQYAIEGSGIKDMVGFGINATTLTPGMKVSVSIHPLVDGAPGGQFVMMTLPDGTVKGYK